MHFRVDQRQASAIICNHVCKHLETNRANVLTCTRILSWNMTFTIVILQYFELEGFHKWINRRIMLLSTLDKVIFVHICDPQIASPESCVSLTNLATDMVTATVRDS